MFASKLFVGQQTDLSNQWSCLLGCIKLPAKVSKYKYSCYPIPANLVGQLSMEKP